jgi:hypothetical protein
MARPNECFKQTNVAAGTYTFTISRGGTYTLAYKGTGSGTVDLKVALPDRSTFLAVATQISAATGRQSGLQLEPGAYEFVISGFTANYVSLTSYDLA